MGPLSSSWVTIIIAWPTYIIMGSGNFGDSNLSFVQRLSSFERVGPLYSTGST